MAEYPFVIAPQTIQCEYDTFFATKVMEALCILLVVPLALAICFIHRTDHILKNGGNDSVQLLIHGPHTAKYSSSPQKRDEDETQPLLANVEASTPVTYDGQDPIRPLSGKKRQPAPPHPRTASNPVAVNEKGLQEIQKNVANVPLSGGVSSPSPRSTDSDSNFPRSEPEDGKNHSEDEDPNSLPPTDPHQDA